MNYTINQLIGLIIIFIGCPCSILITVTCCLVGYKRYEANGFKKKEKKGKHERRQLNG